MIRKTLNFIFVTLWILFAAVQYNDPDFLIWALIYLVPATNTILVIKTKSPKWLNISLAVVYLVGALYLIPSDLTNWIDDEDAREGFGLLLASVWLLFLEFQVRLHFTRKS